MKIFTISGRLDQLGMTTSIACAIHCAALPLVTTTLPLLGLEFLASLYVEILMICISIFIGVWSMFSSFRKHGNFLAILILIGGFILIATGHFLWNQMESILVPIGAFTIAAAHFINWKHVRSCKHTH